MHRQLLRCRRAKPPRLRLGRLRCESPEPRRLLAVFTVNNFDDGGAGSLRQAVLDANATTGPDQIMLGALGEGTIHLTSGELKITDDLEIIGTLSGSSPLVTIDAQGGSRIFNVDDGSLCIFGDGQLTHRRQPR